MKTLLWGSGLAAVLIIVQAISISPLYWAGLVLCAAAAGVALYLSRRGAVFRILLRLRQDWGIEHLAKERDVQAAAKLFDHVADVDEVDDFIDDQTWADLNVDQLYLRIDRALSDPGEAVLYDMLREPSFDPGALRERGSTIAFLETHQQKREEVQLQLMRLGHQSSRNDVFHLLWNEGAAAMDLRVVATILAIAAVASLGVAMGGVVLGAYGLAVLPIALFLANGLVHYRATRDSDQGSATLGYLLSCIATAGRLSSINAPELESYTAALKEQHDACQPLAKASRWLLFSNMEVADPSGGFAFLWQFVNIFFLIETRGIYGTRQELATQQSTLRDLYRTIGTLDALQSVASYRASLDAYAVPDLVEGKPCLELVDARHPLVINAVPASIEFHKNVVMITGSNMGGKSTFLRNVGSNVLLAQTIATTLTKRYRGTPFRIITSISGTDDVVAGKSFYFVEAERILDAIEGMSDEVPSLCILDELLAGTNAIERHQASAAIVRYFAEQNAMTVVATHDTELASEMGDVCDLYHFADVADETGLRFDYKLRPGVATTHNAIALLRYLGYPKEITDGKERDAR